MLTELRTKSQITIPKDIVNHLGLAEGDKLEVREHNGVIQIIPVAVYPKRYLEELRSEIDEAKAKVAAGDGLQNHIHQTLFEELQAPERR